MYWYFILICNSLMIYDAEDMMIWLLLAIWIIFSDGCLDLFPILKSAVYILTFECQNVFYMFWWAVYHWICLWLSLLFSWKRLLQSSDFQWTSLLIISFMGCVIGVGCKKKKKTLKTPTKVVWVFYAIF